MNFDLRTLLAEITQASLRTKAVALGSLLALAALLWTAGVVSSQAHYVTLYAGLDDAERVAVEKALAEGAVRFRVSNFPGPYVVYVDESQFDQAQIQVALAEALKRRPDGMDAGEGGASTIFMSSGERAQSMLKREWQETENLLAQFDFVQRATVTTSIPDPSVLRRKEPLTVSVALKLRGGGELSAEQAENVAKLVRFRFGVPPQNVVISDQSGRTVYDPGAAGPEADTRRLLEHAAGYDRELAAKVNGALERAFGADRAYVTITSEWDSDQTTTVSESLDGEPRELTVEKTESRTPGDPEPAGGLAGVSSNVVGGLGTENASTGDDQGAGESTTLDERTTYELPRSRTQTVRVTPQLARLNVSLVVDATLEAKKDEIRTMVASAVGLDEKRHDVLGVTVADMGVAEPAAEGDPAPGATEEGGGGLSPTTRLLLQRGVEIVSALAFVVLLVASLRGARRGAAQATAAASAGDAEPQIDPEALARARIEELVRTDPRRVGEVLSRWASEETYAGS